MFIAVLALAAVTHQGSFDTWMSRFENDKRTSNWTDAEQSLDQALLFRRTDYAVHSLSWVYGLQGRIGEALDLSKKVVAEFGPTPIALHGLTLAALKASDLPSARSAIAEARARGYDAGQGWISDSILQEARELKEVTTPAIYELHWAIPAARFQPGQSKKFLFPQAKSDYQRFTFTLPTGTRYEVHDDGNLNIVSIWGDGKSDVPVSARAVLYAEYVPWATRPAVERVRLKTSLTSLGPLYYYTERIDPSYIACRSLAGQLRKPELWATMQAIVDWRGKNITYAEPPPGNTLETILASHKGVCHHSAYLTVSLARACGIRADVVGGFVLPEAATFKDAEGSHGWGEFYLPGKGWVEFESQDASSLGHLLARRHYLRYKAQNETSPFSADWTSCQEFKVSGRRLQ